MSRSDRRLTPEAHLLATLDLCAGIVDVLPEMEIDIGRHASIRDEYPLSAEAAMRFALARAAGHDRRVLVARARLASRAIRSGRAARALWDHAHPLIEYAEWTGRDDYDKRWAQAYSPTIGLRVMAGSASTLPSATTRILRGALMAIASELAQP